MPKFHKALMNIAIYNSHFLCSEKWFSNLLPLMIPFPGRTKLHTHRENAPPPYVFCIFEFVFRYLLASPFGFVYYVLTQKNCWFHLGSIALDSFGELQKIRYTEKSDTLFFTSMNIETLVWNYKLLCPWCHE